MSIRVNRKMFLAVLNEMGAVSPRNDACPILQCVWIKAEDGHMKVRATDLEVHIERTIETEGGEEFCAAVDLRRLISVVKSATGKDLDIALDGSGFEISEGGSSTKLEGRDQVDFPAKPSLGQHTLVAVDMSRLYTAIDRVAFAQGKEEYRLLLHGVYIHFLDPATLRVVACDGHRLAYYDLPILQNAGEPGVGQILAAPAVKAFLRGSKNAREIVTVHISPDAIALASEGLEIFSKHMGLLFF